MGFGKRKNRSKKSDNAAAAAEAPAGDASPSGADQKRAKVDQYGPKIALENAKFEQYYKAQGIVPPEEWDAFMTALRSPLPSSFRVCEAGGNSQEILRRLQNEFSIAAAGESAEETALRPSCVQWYPNEMAWQSRAGRKELRKIPHLAAYHKFMYAVFVPFPSFRFSDFYFCF
jgi:hypothetical protein